MKPVFGSGVKLITTRADTLNLVGVKVQYDSRLLTTWNHDNWMIPEKYSVRLETYPRGRLNIWEDGQWKTMIGNYFWDNEDGAAMMCR